MKRLRFLPSLLLPCCLAILTPNAACAQNVTTWAQSYGVGSYDSSGQPYDDSVYGTGSDLPYAIAPMPDGGVVVSGRLGLFKYVAPYYGARGTAIVRYDRGGAIVWQTLLRQDNDKDGHIVGNTVNFLRTDAVGNIFVAGGTGNPDNGGLASVVAKFSAEGALLWQTHGALLREVYKDGNGNDQIDENGFLAPYGMDLTTDGGVVICGSVYADSSRGGGAHTIPFLIKYNADGSLAFHREYASDNQYSGTTSVCQRPDADGYALILPQIVGKPDNLYSGFILMFTDAVGNPVSQRIFDIGYHRAGADYITRSSDGGYLLSGAVTNQGEGTEIRKLRADGSKVWAKMSFSFDSRSAGPVSPTPDGGCLFGGQGVPGPIGLYRLDKDGKLQVSHFYGGASEGVPAGLGTEGTSLKACVTTDGGLAFTVNTFTYATGSHSKGDWWVLKTAPDGHLPGFVADTNTDKPLADSQDVDSDEAASYATDQYGAPPSDEANPGIALASGPAILLENLAMEDAINLPTVQVQAAPVTGSIHGLFFTGEAALGNGAYYLQFAGGNPFGYYSYLPEFHYLYHFDLGYEYVFDAADGHAGVYLYDFKSGGFFYTSPVFPFPYLYDFTLNTVLYYYPDPSNPGRYNTDGYRFFYRFDNGQIISK